MLNRIQRSESGCRRKAAKQGLQVRKLRASSPHYWSSGPYVLVDVHTNGVVAQGLDLTELMEEIDVR